jgi:hypothetical protein
MGLKARLRKIVFCAILAMASIAGANLRPEQVEEMMRDMNQPKVAHHLADRDVSSDP